VAQASACGGLACKDQNPQAEACATKANPKSITNPETFRAQLMVGDTAKPRRKYLKEIANQVTQGVIGASPEQLRVLQDFY
jgi:hypothetical protein